MTDERREGRSEGREDARMAHVAGFLADATAARHVRIQRALAAVERLGEGAVYGTDVVLTVEQAERLVERLHGLQQKVVAPGPAYWPRGGEE